MSLANGIYQAEKHLVKEYYNTNRDMFAKGDQGKIGKLYQWIVSPITFSVVQSAAMFYCIKNIKSNNKLMCITKAIGLTVLNANVFLFSYKDIDKPSNSYRLFRSFMNPLFTLQKDKFILSFLSISNRFALQSTDTRTYVDQPKVLSNNDNKKKIVEGFL